MQPIVIANVQLTQAEYMAINWPLLLRKRGWVSGLLIGGAVIFMCWNTGVYQSSSLLYQAGTTLALLVAMAFLMRYSYRRAIRKQYDSTPLLQEPVTYRLSSEGVEKSSSLQHLTLPWSSCQGVRRFGRWYFLETGPQRGEFLDPACLVAPATEEDLQALLTQQGLRLL